MSLDQEIILVAISAYIMSTLALFTYLLSREPVAKALGIPFAFAGCITSGIAAPAPKESGNAAPGREGRIGEGGPQ